VILIIGLGNPGEEYKNTRHNIGREVAEKCAKKNDLPDFEYDKKSNALVAQGKIGPASAKGYSEAKKEKVVFALPETFMNKSGLAVSALAKYYKIKPEQIFIAHDDVDLPVGRMKISFDKSSAGHKGVENVMKNLKTQKFWRGRIGIGGKSRVTAPSPGNVVEFITRIYCAVALLLNTLNCTSCPALALRTCDASSAVLTTWVTPGRCEVTTAPLGANAVPM